MAKVPMEDEPKRKNNVKPTLKQRKAVENMVENGGVVSRAMRDAGYSSNTAINPDKLTESVGFQQLVAQYLPDDLLLKVHTEGLKATKVISAHITNKDADINTDDFIEVPDHPTRHKFLVTGYEIVDKLKPKEPTQFPLQVNVLVQHTIEQVYGSKPEPSESS